MATVLTISPDKRNFPLWDTPKAVDVSEAQMPADTNVALNIAGSGYRFVIVGCEEDVFYSHSAIAALPSSATFVAGDAELIRSGRVLNLIGVTGLNFRSVNQNRITLAFYQ